MRVYSSFFSCQELFLVLGHSSETTGILYLLVLIAVIVLLNFVVGHVIHTYFFTVLQIVWPWVTTLAGIFHTAYPWVPIHLLYPR